MRVCLFILFIIGGMFVWALIIPIWFLTGKKPNHQGWKTYGIIIRIGIWILIFLLITGVFHYVLSFGTFFVLTLFGVSSLVMGIF